MRRAFAVFVTVLFIVGSIAISNDAGVSTIKNGKVIARITYRSNEFISSSLQPLVVITQPEDGAVVTDPHLVVLGYASDEAGMNYWEWEWRFEGGSYSNSSYFETAQYVEFRIDIYGLHPGWNLVTVRFKNIYGAWGEDSVNVTYNPPNNPPNKPSKPEGPNEGKVGATLYFSTVTTDPDGDSLEYLIDWGDGSDTGWQGPIASGYPFETFHVWTEPGTYEVRAKARDIPYYEESEWSEPLIVTIYEEENDTEPPVVVKKYPPDGATFTEPNITAWGYITDNVGVASFGYTHEWEGGGTGSSWPLEEPTTNYSFEIPLTLHLGWNRIRIEAWDAAGNYGYDEETVYYTLNHPPNIPQKPSGEQDIGPSKKDYDREYEYTTKATDPDGDRIKYGWDWNGDGIVDQWTDFYPSGQECKVKHKWEIPKIKGGPCPFYGVKVKAVDENGAESIWSDCLWVGNHVDSDKDGWCNCQEIYTYHTDETKKDTDGDGTKDSKDMDPLCNLKLTVEINRVKDLRGGEESDFYAVISIWNGWRFVRHRTPVIEDDDDITPNWRVTQDIPDNIEEIPIKIRIFDEDPLWDDWCDINHKPSAWLVDPKWPQWWDLWGKDCDIKFKVRENEWEIDDQRGDRDGYGFTSGDGDGEDEELDTEVWFKVYLNDCKDNDGLSYWQEIGYGTDPTKTNNKYAILISGGIRKEDNYARYWNDLYYMYSILKEYGFTDNNIYVLYADGNIPSNTNCKDPENIKAPKQDIIDYSATRSKLETVFDELANKMTDNDLLFIYTTNHGGFIDSNGNNGQEAWESSILWLWGANEYVTDSEFAGNNYLGKITKYRCIIIVMEQCYSGGFIDDIDTKPNCVILTSCGVNEKSYGCDTEGKYDEFSYHFMNALSRRTPYWEKYSRINADKNNDGYISMQEAFNYAKSQNSRPQHPQCHPDLRDLWSFFIWRGFR